MNALASDVHAERKAIVATLHAALDALEAGDQAVWRNSVDELIQWRTRPLVQGLARLANELRQALGDSSQSSGDALPEACARLEHVVRMSEDASHHTLDLIQECSTLLGTLSDAAGADGGEPGDTLATVAAIRSRLSEMTAAQGYQDLTGQIIRRVVELVRAVHEGLGGVVGVDHPLQLANGGEALRQGQGPALAGIDPAPASQDDANQLLSSLGL